MSKLLFIFSFAFFSLGISATSTTVFECSGSNTSNFLKVHLGGDTWKTATAKIAESIPISSEDFVELYFYGTTYRFNDGHYQEMGDGDARIIVHGNRQRPGHVPTIPIYLSYYMSGEGVSSGFFINETGIKLNLDFEYGCQWTGKFPE